MMTKRDALLYAQEAALWREVDGLLKEAAKKTRHIERLRENDQTPMMMSDTPMAEWCGLVARFNAIGAMRQHYMEARAARRKRPTQARSGK